MPAVAAAMVAVAAMPVVVDMRAAVDMPAAATSREAMHSAAATVRLVTSAVLILVDPVILRGRDTLPVQAMSENFMAA